MISEKTKSGFKDTVTDAFNKYLSRYGQAPFAGKPESDIGRNELVVRFLQRYTLDINLHMQVLISCANDRTILKRRSVMTKAAILCLADGSFALSELWKGMDSDSWNGSGHNYTDRQMRRLINEVYSGALSEADSKPRAGDGRKRWLSGVFSVGPAPAVADPASAYLDSGRHAAGIGSGFTATEIFFTLSLRFMFPQFLEDIEEFMGECSTVFASLGRRNERIDFLRDHLTRITPMLLSFYSDLTAILGLEWFLSKSRDKQERLLKSDREVRNDRDELERAAQMLTRICGQDMAFRYLSLCSIPLIRDGRLQQALSMLALCLTMAREEIERGIMQLNVAVIHTVSGDFERALDEARGALPHLEASGDTHWVCNALALIGVSQWRLGCKDLAMKAFGEAERRGRAVELGERWMIQFILGMSFWRLGEMSLRKKHLTVALSLIPEEETEGVIWLNQLIDCEHSVYSGIPSPPMRLWGIGDVEDAAMHGRKTNGN